MSNRWFAQMLLLLVLPLAAHAFTTPALPAANVDVTLPTVNGTTYNATCATFQAQLDAAAAANVNLTHEIILATGTTCTGPYFLSAHVGGTGWILIKGPNYASLPAAGIRVSLSDATLMPKIQYGAGADNGSIVARADAQRYRFIGIRFVENAALSPNYGFIIAGQSNTAGTNTGYIILDRSVCEDSRSPATMETIRCFLGNATAGHIAMIESYCYGMGRPAQESQCFSVDSNPGPILLRNNYLEATGENTIICGGLDPGMWFYDSQINLTNNTITLSGLAALLPQGQDVSIGTGSTSTGLPAPLASLTQYYIIAVSSTSTTATIKLATSLANATAGTAIDLTTLGLNDAGTPAACTGGYCIFNLYTPTVLPADITVTRNTYNTPSAIRGELLGYTNMKSLFELKCGVRVLIEGNDFLNMPWDGLGNAFRMTARNVNGPGYYVENTDITIRYNLVANVANWIGNALPSDDGQNGHTGLWGGSKRSKRWYIHDNLVYGLNYTGDCGTGNCSGNGTFFNTTGGGAGVGCTDPNPTSPGNCQMEDVTITHNTVHGVSISTRLFGGYSPDGKNLTVQDNLFAAGSNYGFFTTDGSSLLGTAALNHVWSHTPGASWIWTNNGLSNIGNGDSSGSYPAGSGNTYPASSSTFAWVSPCTTAYNCSGTYDYTLQVGSPAIAAASDGTNQGVNFTAYNAARSGAGGGGSTPTAVFPAGLRIIGGIRFQ